MPFSQPPEPRAVPGIKELRTPAPQEQPRGRGVLHVLGRIPKCGAGRTASRRLGVGRLCLSVCPPVPLPSPGGGGSPGGEGAGQGAATSWLCGVGGISAGFRTPPVAAEAVWVNRESSSPLCAPDPGAAPPVGEARAGFSGCRGTAAARLRVRGAPGGRERLALAWWLGESARKDPRWENPA